MISDILLCLRLLGLFSPSTNLIASMMFDLPDPFGPVMLFMPFSNCIETGLWGKDLNPFSVSLDMYTNFLNAWRQSVQWYISDSVFRLHNHFSVLKNNNRFKLVMQAEFRVF